VYCFPVRTSISTTGSAAPPTHRSAAAPRHPRLRLEDGIRSSNRAQPPRAGDADVKQWLQPRRLPGAPTPSPRSRVTSPPSPGLGDSVPSRGVCHHLLAHRRPRSPGREVHRPGADENGTLLRQRSDLWGPPRAAPFVGGGACVRIGLLAGPAAVVAALLLVAGHDHGGRRRDSHLTAGGRGVVVAAVHRPPERGISSRRDRPPGGAVVHRHGSGAAVPPVVHRARRVRGHPPAVPILVPGPATVDSGSVTPSPTARDRTLAVNRGSTLLPHDQLPSDCTSRGKGGP
jgi:hypothetical protein